MTDSDERRVIEALRAFTGGLTVTDQDITTAESRLKESFEPPHSPRRGLVILAAAVAAVLVVGFFVSQAIDRHEDSAPPAANPSSPAEALEAALQADAYDLDSEAFGAGALPTAGDMAGFWLLREPFSAPLLLDGNGDWRIGFSAGAAWHGTSALDGDTWTRRHDDSTGCAEENGVSHFSHSWRTALAQDGSLRLQLTRGINVCTPAEDREVWDRVAPGSPVSDYLVAATKEADWHAAPRTLRWLGLYVAPGTGHVLEVADDGTYRYYDSLSDVSRATDHGELGVDGRQTEGSCAGGRFSGTAETTQLPGVPDYVGSYDAFRLDITMNTCESSIGNETVWVHVFS